jgi:thioesterase domain-containing protein/acyl carrier protein
MSVDIARKSADRESRMRSRQLGKYTPPRGAIEAAVAAIYAELLGLDSEALSATANFFDLGGTSLGALDLKRKLERSFDLTDISIGTILQNPTVRGLAARATAKRRPGKNGYNPIVPLQFTGSKTPLFCVHPGNGEVLGFVELAKSFANERPFYGLRARGFDEGEGHFVTFDEMVFTYVDAIRRRQPRGPYAVVGYSYGGPVAFEIAKALESKGERVAFVGSIDMPPRLVYLFDEVGCVINLAWLLSLINDAQAEELSNELRAARSAQDAHACLMHMAAPGRVAALGLDLPRFRTWAGVAQSLLTVGRSYVPSGMVESVTVFYAHLPRGKNEDWMMSQMKRWDGFARTPNRYIDVAGDHWTLMGPRHVASFQAVLRAELDRALGGH